MPNERAQIPDGTYSLIPFASGWITVTYRDGQVVHRADEGTAAIHGPHPGAGDRIVEEPLAQVIRQDVLGDDADPDMTLVQEVALDGCNALDHDRLDGLIRQQAADDATYLRARRLATRLYREGDTADTLAVKVCHGLEAKCVVPAALVVGDRLRHLPTGELYIVREARGCTVVVERLDGADARTLKAPQDFELCTDGPAHPD